MMTELKNKCCNIIDETVMVYLKLIKLLKKAVHPARKELVSKPILKLTFNSQV